MPGNVVSSNDQAIGESVHSDPLGGAGVHEQRSLQVVRKKIAAVPIIHTGKNGSRFRFRCLVHAA